MKFIELTGIYGGRELIPIDSILHVTENVGEATVILLKTVISEVNGEVPAAVHVSESYDEVRRRIQNAR